MAEAHFRLRVDPATIESVAAMQVAPNQYRLQSTPLMSPEPLHLGDVIEVEQLADGAYSLRKVVSRAPYRHHSWVVNRWFAGSPEYRQFATAVKREGGMCEAQLGGLVYAHIPEASPFDADSALDHHLRLNAKRPVVRLRSFFAKLLGA